ncbi:MAG: DUF362 domain-containing protein [Bacteroidetes bacterium]|nr:DUF362 domain-containing protein [Bacteroidota bacterium]
MMKRRHFLQAGVLGASALGLASMFRLDSMFAASPAGSVLPAGTTQSAGAALPAQLSIVEGTDIAAAVRTAVQALGGMDAFVSPGDVVLLKPNMSFPNPPEWGSTTHPDVIREVVRLCAEAGARRIIATDFPMRRSTACLERSGMTALTGEMPDLSFVELGEEQQFEVIASPDTVEFKEIAVAKILQRADVLINLPTAKHHGGTTVSFGMKNLMGLIYDRRIFHGTYDLSSAVADLAFTIRPQLTIMDAVHALLDSGPQGPGTVQTLNYILAGIDPVAVDAATLDIAQWAGRTLNPSDVRHIALAAERGAGSLQIAEHLISRNTLG